MANAIKISSLEKEIQNTLNMYHQDITNQIKVVTKEVANELGKTPKVMLLQGQETIKNI